MYFIDKGLVACHGNLLHRGKLFGLDVIRNNPKNHDAVLSLTYTSLFYLPKSSLQDILSKARFSKTRKILQRAAVKRAFIAFARLILEKSRHRVHSEPDHTALYTKYSLEQLESELEPLLLDDKKVLLSSAALLLTLKKSSHSHHSAVFSYLACPPTSLLAYASFLCKKVFP